MLPKGEFSYFLSSKTKWPFNNHMALYSTRSFIQHLFLHTGFLIKYTAVTKLNEPSCFCGQSLLPSNKFSTAKLATVPVLFLLSQGISHKKKKKNTELFFKQVTSRLLRKLLLWIHILILKVEIFPTSHSLSMHSFSAELFKYKVLYK